MKYIEDFSDLNKKKVLLRLDLNVPIKDNKIIDKIILGFESSKQLKEILKIRKIKKRYSFPKIKCEDRKLLDPSNWKKLI